MESRFRELHTLRETVDKTYDSILKIVYFDLVREIGFYEEYFTDFGECNNSIIISGTLDSLSFFIKDSKLKLEKNIWLLEAITEYIIYVQTIYELIMDNPIIFEYMNLDSLENKFRIIQEVIEDGYNSL